MTLVKLFLYGDIMTGRGIDQALPLIKKMIRVDLLFGTSQLHKQRSAAFLSKEN
jgi:hypothetical protein